jgi:Protein of unknown function (DUF2586)
MLGSVDVILLNLGQGGFKEVEGTFLYVGTAPAALAEEKKDEYVMLGPDSDLDVALGADDSELKTQIMAAIVNANSTEFCCYALPCDAASDQAALVADLLDKPADLLVEAVAFCDAISGEAVAAKALIESGQTLANSIKSVTGKVIQVIYAVDGCNSETETWVTYKARVKSYITDVAAPNVSIVLQLHGNNLGVVCGRICTPAVNLADSPMRVATGALVGLGSAPVDSAGAYLKNADYKELSLARFCVPQYYAGFDGMYWADMMTLDAEAGDFQVFEHLRVLHYHARRIRIMGIRKVADRSLNDTPASIAAHEQLFAKTLRAASKPVIIAGQEFPGMNEPPEDGDVGITWIDKNSVNIAITVTPYNCPKKITIYLALDLSAE